MLLRVFTVLALVFVSAGAALNAAAATPNSASDTETAAALENDGPALRDKALTLLENWPAAEPANALELLAQAVALNDAEAMFILGFIYFYGELVDKDLNQTETLWQNAAGLGHAEAMYSLGSFYLHGFNGGPNSVKALEWYEKAYHKGYVEAAYDLGMIYKDGLGVPADVARGLMWLEQGASQGDANAKGALGIMYYRGDGVNIDKTKAFGYLKDLEESGDPAVLYYLGELYLGGLAGLPKDEVRALECYEAAAVQNYGPAQYALAQMYALGQGDTAKNVIKAYLWYSLAANNNEPQAHETAALYAKEMTAAEMGVAQVGLARAYAFGFGAVRDKVKALAHLNIARHYGEDVTVMVADVARDLSDADVAAAENEAKAWLNAQGPRALDP